MNQDLLLHGKIAVVTGAAGGIGTGIAKRFSALGASVVLLEPDPHRLVTLASELTRAGATVLSLACDVTDVASIQNTRAQVLAASDRSTCWSTTQVCWSHPLRWRPFRSTTGIAASRSI